MRNYAGYFLNVFYSIAVSCVSLPIKYFSYFQTFFLSQQSNPLKLLLITYSCNMPSQSAPVLGTETLFCTQQTCPGTPPAPHPGRGSPSLCAQGSTTVSDPSSLQDIFVSHTSSSSKSIQPVLQQEQMHGSQTCSDTHHQSIKLQPQNGAVSAAVEAGGDRGKGDGAAETEKHHCGLCGHLLLAVVLVVFSPLVALGVCMADILTGACCDAHGKDKD